MTTRAAKPRGPGRPPRLDKATTERIEVRATAAERSRWLKRAGDQPLGVWIRERLNADG